MHATRLDNAGGPGSFALVFDSDDEVTAGLLDFARQYNVEGAYFTGIGALRDVTLGYWRWETREYAPIRLAEQVEVLSLAGNVARGPDGAPKIHAHIVVGRADGSAHGGHLLEGRVRPTLEVMLVETPRELRRSSDPATGLALLDLTDK